LGLNWYALRSKPHKEGALWRLLRDREVPVFYPRLLARPVNPRASRIRPYFPGYLFIRAEQGSVGLRTFQWMPHALGVVCFGDEPASVPDALIHALRRKVEGANQAENELGLWPAIPRSSTHGSRVATGYASCSLCCTTVIWRWS
jgi:transcriptional antiterminator RfaH